MEKRGMRGFKCWKHEERINGGWWWDFLSDIHVCHENDIHMLCLCPTLFCSCEFVFRRPSDTDIFLKCQTCDLTLDVYLLFYDFLLLEVIHMHVYLPERLCGVYNQVL